MTLLADFLQALTQIDAGQKRTFAHPPASLNAADLPALWVELPSSESAVIAFSGAGWPTLKARVVLAIAPVAQDTAARNFADVVAACDTLHSALIVADAAESRLSFSLRVAVVEVAGAAFWAVIADVEGRG